MWTYNLHLGASPMWCTLLPVHNRLSSHLSMVSAESHLLPSWTRRLHRSNSSIATLHQHISGLADGSGSLFGSTTSYDRIDAQLRLRSEGITIIDSFLKLSSLVLVRVHALSFRLRHLHSRFNPVFARRISFAFNIPPHSLASTPTHIPYSIQHASFH